MWEVRLCLSKRSLPSAPASHNYKVDGINIFLSIELCIQSLKEEGRNRGFDPLLKDISIKSVWERHVTEPI